MEINRRTTGAWKAAMDRGRDKIVLLCDARLRAPLAQMLSRTLPMLAVVAYDEILLGVEIEPVETISIDPQNPGATAGQEDLAVAGAQT